MPGSELVGRFVETCGQERHVQAGVDCLATLPGRGLKMADREAATGTCAGIPVIEAGIIFP
jgi:hypothetical protein